MDIVTSSEHLIKITLKETHILGINMWISILRFYGQQESTNYPADQG